MPLPYFINKKERRKMAKKRNYKQTMREREEMDRERRAKAQGIAPAVAKDLNHELDETWRRFRDIISLIESKRITPEIKSELLLAGLEMADNFLHFWKVERQIFSKALYPPEYEEAIKAEREAAEAESRAQAAQAVKALFQNVEELAETGESAGYTEVEISEAVNYFTEEELAEMQAISNRAGERIRKAREAKEANGGENGGRNNGSEI